jgi:hypothetical protein
VDVSAHQSQQQSQDETDPDNSGLFDTVPSPTSAPVLNQIPAQENLNSDPDNSVKRLATCSKTLEGSKKSMRGCDWQSQEPQLPKSTKGWGTPGQHKVEDQPKYEVDFPPLPSGSQHRNPLAADYESEESIDGSARQSHQHGLQQLQPEKGRARLSNLWGYFSDWASEIVAENGDDTLSETDEMIGQIMEKIPALPQNSPYRSEEGFDRNALMQETNTERHSSKKGDVRQNITLYSGDPVSEENAVPLEEKFVYVANQVLDHITGTPQPTSQGAHEDTEAKKAEDKAVDWVFGWGQIFQEVVENYLPPQQVDQRDMSE